MTRKRRGLGKGLDALIPSGESALTGRGITQIPAVDIQPNPRQPRANFDPEELAELAASIKEHGVIQPLLVRRGDFPRQYTLIAGERRLQAARQAGLGTVPAIVREASDQELIELALIENVQRADLSPLETAEAYRQLSEDFGLSQDAIARRVGKSRVAITNTMRLLKLASSVQQALVERRITEGHARALLGLSTPQAQSAALQTVTRKQMTVRQTEELVRKLAGQKPQRPSKPGQPPEIKALEEQFRTQLGTKVTLNHRRKGGTITIHYYSEEELDTLVDRILGEV
ncbi:MAG: ParB/RepB/Spo0J family partition protein [Anaerolineales bacterium]